MWTRAWFKLHLTGFVLRLRNLRQGAYWGGERRISAWRETKGAWPRHSPFGIEKARRREPVMGQWWRQAVVDHCQCPGWTRPGHVLEWWCGVVIGKKSLRAGERTVRMAISKKISPFEPFPCQKLWTKLWIEGSKLWIAPAKAFQSCESPFPPAKKSWIDGEVRSCEWRSVWGRVAAPCGFFPSFRTNSRFTVGARTATNSHYFSWDPYITSESSDYTDLKAVSVSYDYVSQALKLYIFG